MIKLAGAAWVIALLAWLPFEDTTTVPALAFALAGVGWLAWRDSPNWQGSLPRAIAAGAGLGFAVPLTALLLMAFKSGLHGHGFAEYTAAQVWSVIQTSPFWPLAGIFLSALAWQIRRRL